MSTPAKIFALNANDGTEVLSVDADGNFYVRGEGTESTDSVRTIFLEFAKQFLIDRINNKTVLAIRSSVPSVLRAFATPESRQTPEFAAALARAQTRPLIDFAYSAATVHPHVFVGLLQEAIQYVLSAKLTDDQAAAKRPAVEPPPPPIEEPTEAAPPRGKKRKKASE